MLGQIFNTSRSFLENRNILKSYVNPGIYRVTSTFILYLSLAGCSTFSLIPMPIALFRSPVTVNPGNINSPINPEEKCRLKLISEQISLGKTRDQAIEKYGYNFNECLPKFNSQEGYTLENNFDSLEDLLKSETVVFAAMSGGGARAAVLAKHTMALLERAYNRLALHFDITRNTPMVTLIDAFSTVSGGSLYNHLVAQAKTILDRTRTLKRSGCYGKAYDDFLFCDPIQSEREIPNHKRLLIQRCEWQRLPEDKTDAEHFEVYLSQDRWIGENSFGSGLEKFPYSEDNISKFEKDIFQILSLKSLGPSQIGFYAAAWYLSPGNLFIGPALTLGTNMNYLDVLAGGLNLSSYASRYDVPGEELFPVASDKKPDAFEKFFKGYNSFYNPRELKMGDLCPKPRFFFNATALETGTPFVFTQSFLHFPRDERATQTVRLDITPTSNLVEKEKQNLKPLSTGFTLEEINSSPTGFPLAYAALSSAAFPIGLEPLEIVKYGYNPATQSIYQTEERLHLSDGGIYDNSGLSTLINLVEFLKDRGVLKRVILLSINADADEYEVNYPTRIASKDYWFNKIAPFKWFDLPIVPFRAKSLGTDALSMIHFTNKRRAEELAVNMLKKLRDVNRADSSFEFLYFPVNLRQLSVHDSHRIMDKRAIKLFEKLQQIPTLYYIDGENDYLLAEAADVIISGEQPGWPVGPRCGASEPQEVNNLGEAFAFALLRTSLSRDSDSPKGMWASPFFGNNSGSTHLLKKWCNH